MIVGHRGPFGGCRRNGRQKLACRHGEAQIVAFQRHFELELWTELLARSCMNRRLESSIRTGERLKLRRGVGPDVGPVSRRARKLLNLLLNH